MGRFNKRGQHTVGMPFGMIFAIILIIVFVVVAFWAVSHFLDIGSCSSVGLFYEELQGEVNDVWASQESKKVFEVDLPSGIERICFANLSAEITQTDSVLEDYDKIRLFKFDEANIFLLPPGKACEMKFTTIEHINITKITETRNPYCVDVSKDLKLQKGFYDKYVTIE